MCDKCDTTVVDDTDTIDNERHSNKRKLNLNKLGAVKFAKNVCEFLMQQDWYGANNSANRNRKDFDSVLEVSNSICEHNIHH